MIFNTQTNTQNKQNLVQWLKGIPHLNKHWQTNHPVQSTLRGPGKGCEHSKFSTAWRQIKHKNVPFISDSVGWICTKIFVLAGSSVMALLHVGWTSAEDSAAYFMRRHMMDLSTSKPKLSRLPTKKHCPRLSRWRWCQLHRPPPCSCVSLSSIFTVLFSGRKSHRDRYSTNYLLPCCQYGHTYY